VDINVKMFGVSDWSGIKGQWGRECFEVLRFRVKTGIVDPKIGTLLLSCPCSTGRLIVGQIVKLKPDNDFAFS
jgi:hypothetical protein